MNRSEFFRSLLGIVGMGQQATSGTSNGGIIFRNSTTCYGLDGKKTDCELKPGESRCPIGHGQKARFLVFSQELRDKPQAPIHHLAHSNMEGGGFMYLPSIPEQQFSAWDEKFVNLAICSTCGIVYIPPSNCCDDETCEIQGHHRSQ